MIEWRKQYAEPERDARIGRLVEIVCTEDLTIQSAKDDADINLMLRRYGVTGQMPVSARTPFYGDFSEVVDFQSALNAVRAAEENFMALPSNVRARFGNDPGLLLEFVSRKENLDEAIRLGLVEAPEVEPPVVPTPSRVEPEKESGNDS